MVATKQKEKSIDMKKHKKAGRPTGSKNSSGIPRTSIIDAIELVKKTYSQYQSNFMSHEELRNAMGIEKGNDTLVTGELSKYGFLEKTSYGWRITELGKNAIDSDKDAIVEAFQKNVILSDLYHKFFDKDVTQGSIEVYLKNKYRKGENTSLIASKFLEAKNYIQSLATQPSKSMNKNKDTGTIEMLRLMYSLFPLEEKKEDVGKDIEELIELAEKNGLYSFANFLQGAKPLINSKDDLKKISNKAIDMFEEDSEITLYPTNIKKKKEQQGDNTQD